MKHRVRLMLEVSPLTSVIVFIFSWASSSETQNTQCSCKLPRSHAETLSAASKLLVLSAHELTWKGACQDLLHTVHLLLLLLLFYKL